MTNKEKNKIPKHGDRYLKRKNYYHDMEKKNINYIVGMSKNSNENGKGKIPKNDNKSKLSKDEQIQMLLQQLAQKDEQIVENKQQLAKQGKKIRKQKKVIEKVKQNKAPIAAPKNVKQITETEKREKKVVKQKSDQLQLTPLEETLIEIRKKDTELQARTDELERKYVKMLTGQDIVMYPKENVSLDEFRREEAAKVNKFGKNSAFVDLFEDRLDNMAGERETISITIYVTLMTGLIEENKTYGPFETEIPELDRRDMYKYMIYTLLVNNFTVLSAQVITKVGAKVLTHNKQFFMEHFMKGVKLESHLLSKHRKIKTHGKTTCVVDYVWDQVKGKPGFRSYNYEKLKSEINSYATVDIMGHLVPKLNTENLIMWAKECHPNVSIHAFDSTYRKFVTHSKIVQISPWCTL